MELLYSPELWEAMAIPEEVESLFYSSTDGPLMSVSIRSKKGEEAVFYSVPTFVFLIFKAKWDALNGGAGPGPSLKN